MPACLRDALSQADAILLLDGPLGTRLVDHGFEVDRPGWSARALLEAPELVERIHREYVAAGSQLLTANTFRTHQRNLDAWGQYQRAEELTHLAVSLARRAAGNQAWVAGSVAPIGDCYSPEQVLEESRLIEEHGRMVENLVAAGVDAVLLETHVSLKELVIAAAAAARHRLPLLISVTTMDGIRMLDGTPLSTLGGIVQAYAPAAVGVNCLPAERVAGSLRALRRSTSLPLLVYANSGERTPEGKWIPSLGADVAAHAREARAWRRLGMRILGGCCGTTPELIAKFSREFRD